MIKITSQSITMNSILWILEYQSSFYISKILKNEMANKEIFNKKEEKS